MKGKQPVNIKIETPFIKLGQLLKMADIVQTGGEAKMLLQQTPVLVNGIPTTERGKKLYPGDWVVVGEDELKINVEG